MSFNCKGMSKSSISTYGLASPTARPVYGDSFASNGRDGNNTNGIRNCSGCEPSVPYVTTLNTLVSFLESLKSSITKYFPTATVASPLQTNLTVQGGMSLALYTRIMWGKKYGKIYSKFDATSLVHVNLLKDIFFQIGYDWHVDEWLNNWPNNVQN